MPRKFTAEAKASGIPNSPAVASAEQMRRKLVLVDGDKTEGSYYIRNIWTNELNFGVEHEKYSIEKLLSKAEKQEETL